MEEVNVIRTEFVLFVDTLNVKYVNVLFPLNTPAWSMYT